jgi:hypothetical protein
MVGKRTRKQDDAPTTIEAVHRAKRAKSTPAAEEPQKKVAKKTAPARTARTAAKQVNGAQKAPAKRSKAAQTANKNQKYDQNYYTKPCEMYH